MKISIDKFKCPEGCNACIEACSKQAIMPNKSITDSCDNCSDEKQIRCIRACPYNLINFELNDSENQRISCIAGWKKIRYNRIDKTFEDNSERKIVEINNEKKYLVNTKNINLEEAEIIDYTLKKYREKACEFDKIAIEEIIDDYCDKNNIELAKEHEQLLIKYIESEITGFSVLDNITQDPELEEITVLNNSKPIYVYHREYGWLETNIVINNSEKIIDIINKMSRKIGRRITLKKPHINANIELGRLHAIIPPIALEGPSITIRKFKSEPFTPLQLVKNNTITSEALALVWLAVQCNLNVLITGNTGSGKTSTLNAIFLFVPQNERVILVEETPEILVPHKHQVKLVTNDDLEIKMHELITDTLRMRPDRIIVSEVRNKEETSALMNTMLAGQGKGSFATFHAQNSQEALIRLQNLGVNKIDLHAIDLIIVQKRFTDNKKNDVRKVTEISTLKKDYAKDPEVVGIFNYDWKTEKLVLNKTNNHITEKIMNSFKLSENDFWQLMKYKQKQLESSPVEFNKFVKWVSDK